MSTEVAHEQVLFEANPKMFRQSPFSFIFCVVLIAVFGLGLILLGVWWLKSKASQLTVTSSRTIIRRGLLSKYTNEVVHRDIRNLQVRQTFLQRIFGVGDIGISSAGQSGVELVFAGLANPYELKAIIDRQRFV